MLTMQNMLSEQLQDFLGLIKQLITNLLGKDAVEWANELKKFLRKEPCWAEEMVYTPLEWGDDLGNVRQDLLQQYVDLYDKSRGGGWRLPTGGELTRKMRRDGEFFVRDKYYWTSTDCMSNGFSVGKEIIKTYDNKGGLCGGRSKDLELRSEMPRLRLCRPIKLPE